jgi:hypothetical protein
MHSLKTPSLTAQTTTGCVSEAFFAPQKGARYLNPQTGLWLSTDPAMGEYVPAAPINDEAKKANQNLPGMGGVFNVVNLHVYHYAGNNPVVLSDPDGRDFNKRIRGPDDKPVITSNSNLARKLTNSESLFVFKILGVSTADYNITLTPANVMSNGEALSLPGGNIYMNTRDFYNTLTTRNGVNLLLHEIFHQYQYENDPGAISLIGDFFGNLGKEFKDSTYAQGSYKYTDLSTIMKLSDIKSREGQAQLVGEFAELYWVRETGGILNPKEEAALYQQARILSNSHLSSEAINRLVYIAE